MLAFSLFRLFRLVLLSCAAISAKNDNRKSFHIFVGDENLSESFPIVIWRNSRLETRKKSPQMTNLCFCFFFVTIASKIALSVCLCGIRIQRKTHIRMTFERRSKHTDHSDKFFTIPFTYVPSTVHIDCPCWPTAQNIQKLSWQNPNRIVTNAYVVLAKIYMRIVPRGD